MRRYLLGLIAAFVLWGLVPVQAVAASYFWVGGAGTWDASSTTHWATSSGGLGGAGVPTSADSVTFDNLSNPTAYTVTITAASAVCANLTAAGPTVGSVTFTGTPNVSGNVSFAASGIIASALNFNFVNTTTVTLSPAGIVVNAVTLNGSGTVQITSFLDCHGITINSGVLQALTTPIEMDLFVGNSGQIIMGTANWLMSVSWTSASSGFTITPGTSAITFFGSGPFTFSGGGLTYSTLNLNSVGTLTINGANTFSVIHNQTQPGTILFAAGSTTTVANFSLAGTSGNLITIGSTTSSPFTISKASGTVNVSFLSISNSVATGGALWRAFTSNGNVDGGGNSGWYFRHPPSRSTLGVGF